jgi:SPP1 gp7 family putative phage head morphogenesis protein
MAEAAALNNEVATELDIKGGELTQEEEEYINDVVNTFILAYIAKLSASRAARILHTAVTELPVIQEAQKEAGKKPLKVPIGDVRAWSKQEVDDYKRTLIEYGGTYIVNNDVLEFKPWMAALKADLVEDARNVIREGKIYGYQPEKLRSELKKAMGDSYNNRLYVASYCESRRGEDLTKRALYSDTNINYVTWHTKKDSKVRPAHREREGKIYLVEECPSLGEPGCRCFIYPYVPKGSLAIPLLDRGELDLT